MVYNKDVERQERKVRIMSEGLFAAYCWLAFIGGLALICFIIVKVTRYHVNRKDRKRHKEHPEFFRLYDDYYEKGNIACRFHNSEIAPRKRKVDFILKDEPYWPQEVRKQKMEEVEKLRREIYTAECMYKGLDKETQEARQKVADYVHANNIKWAGDWD